MKQVKEYLNRLEAWKIGIVLGLIISTLIIATIEMANSASTPYAPGAPTDISQYIFTDELENLVRNNVPKIRISCVNPPGILAIECEGQKYTLGFDPGAWFEDQDFLIVTQDFPTLGHQCVKLGQVGNNTYFACD